MVLKIPPEKFWKLYKTLPDELKEVLSSTKTGDDIFEICQRHGIPEKTEEMLDCVSLVLLGLLSPSDFQTLLEKELKIPPNSAKMIFQEIFRFIFFPVKESLEKFYKEGLGVGKMPGITETLEKPPIKKQEDIYREPIE